MRFLALIQEMLSKLTKIDQRIAFLAMSQYFTLFQVMIPLIVIGFHTVDANVVFRIDLVFKHSNITSFFLFSHCLFVRFEVIGLD